MPNTGYNVNTVSLNHGHICVRIDTDSKWDHATMYDLVSRTIDSGARHILIDKRSNLTPLDKDYAPDTLAAIGQALSSNQAKVAMVLNVDDHLEKLACLSIMRNGGKILSTHNMHEAFSWLGGQIS